MGCSQVVAAVTLVTIAIGFLGLNSAGFLVNHLDVSPAYAGILQGITNTFATVPGFLGPTVVGILTENKVRRVLPCYSGFLLLDILLNVFILKNQLFKDFLQKITARSQSKPSYEIFE